MASTKTLNATNLAALGAGRLADLLLEISAGDAGARRRLRLELVGTAGSSEVVRAVRKRLATIARSRSFIGWDKIKAFAADLEAQHRAIINKVGGDDPAEALELLWRFLAIADSVLARCDDGNGRIVSVFRVAVRDLGPLAEAGGAKPIVLADRAFDALCDSEYGQCDGIIEVLAPALGRAGLEHLRGRFSAWRNEVPPVPAENDRKVLGWGVQGPIYADQGALRYRNITAQVALEQIADALEDVDGFIAQQSDRARTMPAVATAIGQRLLAARRAREALIAIDEADRSRWLPPEWEQCRIDALDALGRGSEAQAFRWECFLRTLNADHLRAHLRKLPDFDDIDAEERALDHAIRYPSVHQALTFFIAWPDLRRAGRLVIDRASELDGNLYEVLAPAADVLEPTSPLAAVILRRAMIDFTLVNARATRYRHAARHLAECASLAARIDDYGAVADHEAYVHHLKSRHGGNLGFWQN